MNQWYLAVRKLLREIYTKALDAKGAWGLEDKGSAETIHGYLRKDYQRLQKLWNERVEGPVPTNLGRHISWGKGGDVEDILGHDLTELGEHLDGLLSAATE